MMASGKPARVTLELTQPVHVTPLKHKGATVRGDAGV